MIKKVSELIKGETIIFEGKEREITFICRDIDPRWADYFLVEMKGVKGTKMMKETDKVEVKIK